MSELGSMPDKAAIRFDSKQHKPKEPVCLQKSGDIDSVHANSGESAAEMYAAVIESITVSADLAFVVQ